MLFSICLFTAKKNKTITISFLFPTSFYKCRITPRGHWSFLPIGALPSPPPWGWSTGFITTPLTIGRLPSQHLDPGLPKVFWFTPTLPTCPTLAKQFLDIKWTLSAYQYMKHGAIWCIIMLNLIKMNNCYQIK